MERARFEAEINDLAVLDRPREFENEQVTTDQVCIFLLDLSGRLRRRELRENIVTKLERKFNALDHTWLRTAKFRFVVIYREQEPSDKEKAGFRKLDFPVYVLGEQHQERTVIALMEKHRIGKTIKGTDMYDHARAEWSNEKNRGLGIPSGTGYRKVGFIKAHKIFEQASDAAQGFVNCIAHEIGHMGNNTTHTSSGLMKYPVSLDADITFSDGDRNFFFGDLARLKKLNLFRTVYIKPPIFREFEAPLMEDATALFPPRLKRVDHFHLRKTPIPTDRNPTDVQEDRMTPEGMNPGFIDPTQDEVIVDKTPAGLDARFKELINRNYGSFKNELNAALVDLTGKKLYAPEYAGWNSTVLVYGASSPKVLAIYAAFQLKADLWRLALREKITSRAALIKRFGEHMRKAGISPAPEVSETNFALTENGTDPVSVEISDALMTHIRNIHNRDLSNSAARQLIKAVGFGYIGSVTAQAGLWHKNRKGLWLSASYDGGAGWAASPVGGYGHTCNALALATFFALLAQGRLVEEPSSARIKGVLRGGSWIEIALLDNYQTQVRNGTLATVPDIEVFSKVGLLTQCTAWEETGGRRKCKSRIATVRQDSALVKRGRFQFVLVALTRGGASRSNVIERLSIDADTLIEEKNP